MPKMGVVKLSNEEEKPERQVPEAWEEARRAREPDGLDEDGEPKRTDPAKDL